MFLIGALTDASSLMLLEIINIYLFCQSGLKFGLFIRQVFSDGKLNLNFVILPFEKFFSFQEVVLQLDLHVFELQ